MELTGLVDTHPDADASLHAPKVADLMVQLARKGTSLREALFNNHEHELAVREAKRVHLTCAKPTSFLPLDRALADSRKARRGARRLGG